jgi:hypothetical protein
MFAAVSLTVLVAHDLSPVLQSGDSRWVLHKAMSILSEGNTSLDEYSDLLGAQNDYAIEHVGGHSYDQFPVGTAIMALPFVAAMDVWYRVVRHQDLREHLKRSSMWEEQRLMASFFVGLTAAFLYLIAAHRLGSVWRSLLIVFVFAFCTSAWSSASRALYQHAPSMLMLTVSLCLIVLAKSKPKLVQYAALPLAFSYVIRPTNSLSIAVLTVLVLLRYRHFFLQYLAWAALVAIPFLAFNWSVYHSLLPSYYDVQRLGTNPHFREALAGNLISPARGLFVFSPVLLLAFLGFAIKWKERALDGLDVCLPLVIVLHWLAISSYTHWWGGYSYGPRLFTDMIPYFVFLLIPVVGKLAGPVTGRMLALASVLVVLTAISFFMHFNGAFRDTTSFWNYRPEIVDRHTERLWDWNDPQFLR